MLRLAHDYKETGILRSRLLGCWYLLLLLRFEFSRKISLVGSVQCVAQWVEKGERCAMGDEKFDRGSIAGELKVSAATHRDHLDQRLWR